MRSRPDRAEARRGRHPRRLGGLWGLLLVLALLLLGCATSVHLNTLAARPSLHGKEASGETPYQVGADSARILAAADPHWQALNRARRLAAVLNSPRLAASGRLYAGAETALAVARQLESQGDAAALDHYVLAAALAHDLLVAGAFTGGGDVRRANAAAFFNVATGKAALALLEEGAAPHRVLSAGGRTFVLELEPAARETRAYYDRFEPAAAYEVWGLRHRHRRAGIGAALIAFRENRRREPIERFYPPEGIVSPVTATLRFVAEPGRADGAPREAALRLSDPRHVESVRLGAQPYPLEADFSAPFAYLLARTKLNRLARTGLLRGGAVEWHRGVFMLEPFDPDKIPVLMVHGLFSSPMIWRDLSNEVMGTRELRSRYQVWHYMYPTASPVLISAERFRADVDELLAVLEAQSGRPVKPMVLVGHSMGGLLIRTSMVDSGPALWNALSPVPFDDLRMASADHEELRRLLFLKRKPWVARAIFFAVPHHGSGYTRSIPAHLARALMRLPEPDRRLELRLTPELAGSLRPAVASFASRPASSIDTLASGDPTLSALAALAVDPAAPFHSIIGVSNRTPDGDESDGVVRRSSAHLEGATSELLLPVRHQDYADPRVLAEIYRILAEHAAATATGAVVTVQRPDAGKGQAQVAAQP
jgi:hypothetical protein